MWTTTLAWASSSMIMLRSWGTMRFSCDAMFKVVNGKVYKLYYIHITNMEPKDKEFTVLVVRIPQTMRNIMDQIIRADTHSNISEFVRDAIRQKIQHENPGLIQQMVRDEIGA